MCANRYRRYEAGVLEVTDVGEEEDRRAEGQGGRDGSKKERRPAAFELVAAQVAQLLRPDGQRGFAEGLRPYWT